jgi:hypothetical protein
MRNGLFSPWETWRKAAGMAMAAFVALLVIGFSMPVGVAATGGLFLAAFIWKDPASTPDYDRVQYTMMTRAYRTALFFVTIKQRAQELFSIVVMVGAGPPREDSDHNLQPGLWPPFRLSAWWAAVGAVFLAPVEFIVNFVRITVWGFTLPWPVMIVLTLPGWYAFFQVLADAKRIAPDKDSGGLAEPAPATMLNMIEDHIELRPSLIRAATYATIPVSVIMVLWATVKWPWWITLIAATVSFALMGAALWSRNLMVEYRAQWQEREARASDWQNNWMQLLPANAGIPIFLDEFELPTQDEFEQRYRQWEASQDDNDDLDDEPPQYEVLVKCAAFNYPPGMSFEKAAMHADGLRGSLGAGLIGITPVGEIDASGAEIPGTVGPFAFRVFYSEQTTTLPDMFDPEADEWATRLSIEAKIIEPISQVKGIGRCVLIRQYMVTKPDSPQQILCVRLRPRNPAVSVDMFLERLNDIQRASQARWVRVGSGNDEGEVVMYLGDEEPVMDVTVFTRPASVEHSAIDRMNWLYYFHANDLRGESGTPRLIRREPTTPVVDKLTFSLPPGLPMKRVRAAEESIATTSGNEFIEIALKEPENIKQARASMSPRKPQSGTQFSIIAAKENPLRRMFNFTDYNDEVLTGREAGVAKIDWAAGVLSDDSLARDNWHNADNPHLLIAGASGSGKSVCMSSMLLQLAYNNGPGEVRLWGIEPKNELQVYRDLDITERFVDSWTPTREFVKNAADLLGDAVQEMDRRNEAFVNHPKAPKQLQKAREIAVRESEQAGTPLERHPLYMPYMFVIIEECASLFAGVRPDEREDQARLIGYATELARKARSSGIHLILATQYPTKESLPVTIRNQCRSIGFKCQNEVASRVVIGETGLEEINIKGAGKLRHGDQFRLFRGFWVQDGDPDHNEQNDILTTLDRLPSNNGQASAMRRSGETPRIVLPDLDESVFSLWDKSSSGGRAQGSLVDSGKGGYAPGELKSSARVSVAGQ